MNMEIFQKKMIDLAACKISPEDWNDWWKTNDVKVREFLGGEKYLRLKPITHGFRWVPILASQKEAIKYLEEHGVIFESATIYQENYRKELEDCCKLQKQRDKEVLAMLKERNSLLFAKYPRFANSLKNTFSVGDRIEQGVTDKDIQAAPCILPQDISAFFKIISVISLDGISIDFSDLRTESLCGKEYVVLGEFWKDADGDLLLIKQGGGTLPTTIYYYCHATNKVKKLCNSMDDLVEKKLSYYNNQ